MPHPIIVIALDPEDPVTRTFLIPSLENRLRRSAEVIWQPPGQTPSESARRQARDARILVTGWGQRPLTDEVLAGYPKLELIAHVAGSVAGFVGPAVYDRNIRVVSGNDTFALSVAEGVLAYILAMQRDIPRYNRVVHEGGWRPDFENRGLFGKRLSLVGFGTIPRLLLPMLEPFGLEIVAYDPYVDATEMEALGVTPATLEDCFRDQDIVSLHLPLLPDTRGMITRAHLDLMPAGSLLVNTSRGAVIDEAALTDCLEEGKIRAALDVFAVEPLPADSRLRSLPNVLLMPHMGGPTLDMRPRAARDAIEDIERFLAGEALHHEINAAKAAKMTRPL